MYLHTVCFSPVVSTLVKAINTGKFKSWPGLTEYLVTKYLPKSQAEVKGHMQQQRKIIRSTKNQLPTLIAPDPVPKNKLTPEPLNTKYQEDRANFLYAKSL